MNIGMVIALIKKLGVTPDPAVIESAVNDYLEEHPEAVAPIDDTAGDGDTDKIWSADKTWTETSELKEAIAYKTPEMFGAVGDGETDDSQAVQDAVDAGYAVYFASNKTYYLASAVVVDHDAYLFGGENATIKTKTPSGGYANIGIKATGTKRFDTTLTGDYSSEGTGDNASNELTLSNMTGIEIGDILVIKATDQYYALNRQYYYLGATLQVTDIYDGHLYTNISMPWDIENTENVTVSVYEAPQVRIDNLHFVSDLDSFGSYNALAQFEYCKNPSITNCVFDHFVIGIYLKWCVNAFVDNLQMSKSKYDNTVNGDGYGIVIHSCTQTIVQRMIALCSQSCLSTSGDIPNIDTYIRNVEVGSEARGGGFGMHENSYNLTIEDSTFAGLNCIGIVNINNCRFIRNNRMNNQYAISYNGLPNAKYAKLRVTNCDFGDLPINIVHSGWQSGIEASDNMIGSIEIINCKGGEINLNPTVDEHNLSNVINEMTLNNWKECDEIYHPAGCVLIKKLAISGCTFVSKFINDHNDSHGVFLNEIEYLDFTDKNPMAHKIAIEKETYGERLTLPAFTPIQLSSENTSAMYVICGKNLVSDDADDYLVGDVSGSEGSALTRTPTSSSSAPTVSIDTDGNLVFTQQNNTSSYCVYPVGMFYIAENSDLTMTATLVNSGATSGATFRPMIAIVNCKTGKVQYRGWGTAVEATAQGASISHLRQNIPADCVAMCYFYCNSAVANAETTFEDYKIELKSRFAPVSVDPDEPYTAVRRTGDGTVYSLNGANNIMCSDSVFSVKLSADFVNSAGEVILDGNGVSF